VVDIAPDIRLRPKFLAIPRKGEFMLRVTFQQLGDTIVFHCEGRIVTGGAYSSLRNAVLSRSEARIVFLDVAQVERIDAGGLGVLLGLREWAHSRAIRFKLMNVTKNVDQLLKLTNLQNVFEFCSVRDLLCLMHRGASVKSWPPEQIDPRQVAPVWPNPIHAAS
jgi:anti-anti-sigma factor